MSNKVFVIICLVFVQSQVVCANVEIAQDNYKYDIENVVSPETESFVVESPIALRTAAYKQRKPMVFASNEEEKQVEKEVVATTPEPVKAHDDKKMVIHFDINKSKLKKGERDKLNDLLNSNITGPVKIFGYTCQLGSDAFNRKLSWARANRVKKFLGKSLKNDLLEEGKPKCCYVSESVLSQNRRVEIIYTEDPKTRQ